MSLGTFNTQGRIPQLFLAPDTHAVSLSQHEGRMTQFDLFGHMENDSAEKYRGEEPLTDPYTLD